MITLPLRSNPAFTLVELLVVIAIIGLLASVVMLQTEKIKIRALDTKAEYGLNTINKAITMGYIGTGTTPPNYGDTGIVNQVYQGCCAAPDTSSNYALSIGTLVSGGYLSDVPKSPRPGYPYLYFNYGKTYNIGTVLATTILGVSNTTGEPGSSRPWPITVGGLSTPTTGWTCTPTGSTYSCTWDNWCSRSTATPWYCVNFNDF